jgi:hypothetical protein
MPLPPEIRNQLIRAGLGAAAGGVVGHEVTPRVLGFYEDEPARRMSTLLDAALFGGLAGMSGPAAAKLFSRPAAIPALAGSIAGAEVIPVAMHGLQQGIGAVQSAERSFSRPPPPQPPTASEQARAALTSPTARGAGVGASAAGLAALVSGLLRPRQEDETEGSRAGMVTRDFLKYLIPALVAGGVIGSVQGRRAAPVEQPQEEPDQQSGDPGLFS